MSTLNLQKRIEAAVNASTGRDDCVIKVTTEAMKDVRLLRATLVEAHKLMGVYPIIPRAQELYDRVNAVVKQYDPDAVKAPA